MTDFVAELDRIIEEKHLLKSEFYIRWSEGKLSKECLREYAKNYYSHVRAFPRYLSSVHCKCEDDEMRKVLLENLIEEEAGTPNHPDMWKQFAIRLGGDDVDTHQPVPEMKKMVDHFMDTCQKGSVAEGVAALYAYESQIPEICHSKIDGLKKHYGMDKPKDYTYFSVHIGADEKHREQEKALLKELVNEDNFEDVKKTVHKTMDHLNTFLNSML